MTEIGVVDELIARGSHQDIATNAIIAITDDQFVVVRSMQVTDNGDEFVYSVWTCSLWYEDEKPQIRWEDETRKDDSSPITDYYGALLMAARSVEDAFNE